MILACKKSWVVFQISLLFLASCRQERWAFLGLSEVFTNNELENAYFPKFLQDLFPYAKRFQKQFRTKAAAKSGIKMIQLKQLSVRPEPSHEANLSWSKDGSLLSYEVVKNRQRKILLRDLSRSYNKTLAIVPAIEDGHNRSNSLRPTYRSYNAFLRWSYDSKKYSFMSNGGQGDFNIYVGSVDSDEHSIAPNPAKDGFATWNPQYNEIVFASARTGKGDLYLFRIGEQEHRLTFNNTPDIYPEWTKDGHGIIYVSGDLQQHKIMVALRDRRSGMWHEPYQFVVANFEQMRPVISPNGKLVVFYAMSEQGYWNLHVLPFRRNKTYRERHLKSSIIARDVYLDLNSGAAWTPDSKKIFYVENNLHNENRIFAYSLLDGKRYLLQTKTSMNHDLLMSKQGVLSFCAQQGSWDRVFMALTNQGIQIQGSHGSEQIFQIKYTH